MSLLEDGILNKVRTLYHVSKDANILKEVETGHLSHNYILSGRNIKLFLKQYRFDNIEDIKNIHAVKFFFAKGGIPVVLPIQTNTGDYIFEYKDIFYSLFSFVYGKIISRINPSPKAFASAGIMLGKIHSLSKNGYPNIVRNHERGFSREKFLSKLAQVREKMNLVLKKTDFDLVALKVLELKEYLVDENTTTYEELLLKNDHIIHGDYHDKNIFYDNKNEVSWVFDLERAGVSPRVLELLRSIDFICLTSEYEEKNFEYARIYLLAYRSIYPIEDDEIIRGLKALYLKKAHSLWIEKEHYLNANTRVDLFIKTDLLMLRYYSRNMHQLAEKLLS